jgi:hypothetical protein
MPRASSVEMTAMASSAGSLERRSGNELVDACVNDHPWHCCRICVRPPA